ncbi:RDD family protein [Pontibacter cellulosilyticus]|uniref:RDD family protein n=1 Tax=Pontibacter cellulosilyticus TaxID=1720253 RepID=UPI001C9B0B1E|nr:RDD family protein [Pontibacter cellulosilyticus]
MQSALTIPNPTVKRTSLYGSLSNRLVSFLVDTSLLVFWYTIILYSTAGETQQLYTWKDLLNDGGFSLGEVWAVFKMLFFNIYLPVLHWLYYTLLESSPKQATIGKFTLGLKVTDLRGKRISFAQANLRYFSKIVSAVPLLLGFLLILTTRRRQMLHDYLARTVVVTD